MEINTMIMVAIILLVEAANGKICKKMTKKGLVKDMGWSVNGECKFPERHAGCLTEEGGGVMINDTCTNRADRTDYEMRGFKIVNASKIYNITSKDNCATNESGLIVLKFGRYCWWQMDHAGEYTMCDAKGELGMMQALLCYRVLPESVDPKYNKKCVVYGQRGHILRRCVDSRASERVIERLSGKGGGYIDVIQRSKKGITVKIQGRGRAGTSSNGDEEIDVNNGRKPLSVDITEECEHFFSDDFRIFTMMRNETEISIKVEEECKCGRCKKPRFLKAKSKQAQGSCTRFLRAVASTRGDRDEKYPSFYSVCLDGSCGIEVSRKTGDVTVQSREKEIIGYMISWEQRSFSGTLKSGEKKTIRVDGQECHTVHVVCGNNEEYVIVCNTKYEECMDGVPSILPKKVAEILCHNGDLIIAAAVLLLVIILIVIIDCTKMRVLLLPYFMMLSLMYMLIMKLVPRSMKCRYCKGMRHWWGGCSMTCSDCGYIAQNSTSMERHKKVCSAGNGMKIMRYSLSFNANGLSKLILAVVVVLIILSMTVKVGADDLVYCNGTTLDDASCTNDEEAMQGTCYKHDVVCDEELMSVPAPAGRSKKEETLRLKVLGSGFSEDKLDIPRTIPNEGTMDAVIARDESGVEETVLMLDMQLSTGRGGRFQVKGEGINKNLEVSVYIADVSIISTYTKMYSTMRTMDISVKGRDQSTGDGDCKAMSEEWGDNGYRCHKESNSNRWGCEMDGCINYYGGYLCTCCKDILDPSTYMQVYKLRSERAEVKFCIGISTETFCEVFDPIHPTATKSVEIITTTPTVLKTKAPKLMGMKNGIAYTGEINELGNYKEGCGQLQILSGKYVGVHDPQYTYKCHDVSDKDITYHQCLKNKYEYCEQLTVLSSMFQVTNAPGLVMLRDHGESIGSMRVKIRLPHVNIARQNFKITAKGKVIGCSGCSECEEGVVCQINVESNAGGLVDLVCEGFTIRRNGIILESGSKVYDVRGDCSEVDCKVKCVIKTDSGDVSLGGAEFRAEVKTDRYKILTDGDMHTHEVAEAACTTILCSLEWRMGTIGNVLYWSAITVMVVCGLVILVWAIKNIVSRTMGIRNAIADYNRLYEGPKVARRRDELVVNVKERNGRFS
ncbi:glycoprotein [Largemouth bass bunyavirus]|uniref:Envelopment polyprotein n=1 Tax=Largemouth bass bunyavirus TaxID=2594110 RepID=A0A514TTQ2_9VIRU|nr:glycoprotein [Largemouth bass bunyavirus]QDJ95876.1 glycoprotein [Largemouth bass bunyavirus]